MKTQANILNSSKFLSWLMNYEELFFPSVIWLLTLVLSFIVIKLFTNCIGVLYALPPGFSSSMGYIHTFGAGFHSWDGLVFLHIAKYGYIKSINSPFFPLLPLLMDALHRLTSLSYIDSGLLIINLSFLIALIFLYKLIASTISHEIAKRTLWLLAVFPASFFFNILYSESLTLMTSVLFFYFLLNNHWYKAMASGFFASIAHTLGVILVVAGFCFLIRKRKQYSKKNFWLKFFSLSIVPSSLMIYMSFLLAKFGNPLIFLMSEKYWDRTFTIPALNVVNGLIHYLLHYHQILSSVGFIFMIHILATFVVIIMSIIVCISYKKHHLLTFEMKTFFILTLLASICSGAHHGSVESYARFVVVLFPAFIIWAEKFKNPTLFLYNFVIMLFAKTIWIGIFATGLSAINMDLH